MLEYLLRTRGSEQELRAIMEATDPSTGVIVQTAYEKLIERGRAEGLAKGEARGLAKGEARGLAKGEARGKAEMLVQLCEARFGAVPPEVVERIRSAPIARLDRWARRLLTASSLAELFADRRRP